MARIEGRRSDDGLAYEIWHDALIQRIPLAAALEDPKLAAAIKRNKWPAILAEGEIVL